MNQHGLSIIFRNALTGMCAGGQLIRWPVWLALGRDPWPAADALVEHQGRVNGAASAVRPGGRQLRWLAVQAVLGPGVLALTVMMWVTATVVVTTPLWWWLASAPVVFVPVTDTASSLLGAVCGLPLVLLAVACGYGLPRWHAAVGRAALEGPRFLRLIRRVEVLTASRAGALEVQAAELRRIERDLHDGAQARLVSAGMLLGLLDVKLEELPAHTRALLTEARSEVGAALQELRDLVHGVYPPILADRGLTGGIESLVERTASVIGSVTAKVEVADRLPAALESTVYFVIAEALTNVAKHSRSGEASVSVHADRDHVRVEVRDNGRGGADERRGSGLAGLRRRAAAFDGVLSLTSPPGGPTVLLMELPCAS
ncbi:Histidine kinase-, DNA gyrase B-, and HSP90-like ATPase [Amycolatopsis pretoriensis]|uniref:histidine kinase n=1 Tax=Amycolatopsis pretoriensis TaxID=218821 RepID=A0A1H5RLW6_9PSEU|nr:histidine kinase [Amycolatopsis pretoriensis]SEF38491.1 Histidine kinase-, DNA gyrase B-, and HSP90-like ATPase [Amycolatopsis pretoriensis]